MLARLVAYVGALALLAIVGVHLRDELPAGAAVEASANAGWSLALRSHPAFAVSQLDLPDKTDTYEILRHPEGAARTSFVGQPKAKSQLRSSKSIAPAVNRANPDPSPK